MNWSIAFEPLLSWPLLAARRSCRSRCWRCSACGSRQRGALVPLRRARRAGRWRCVNPVLLDEEREPLKSVVALVVDRSQSQDIGDRTGETDAALAGLQERLARFQQFEVRVVEAGRPTPPTTAPRRGCSARWTAPSATCRPRASAAPIMITDGQVHDVPADARRHSARRCMR